MSNFSEDRVTTDLTKSYCKHFAHDNVRFMDMRCDLALVI